MTAKEDREKEKTSRETLGKFFFDLAKTCFAALVVGDFVSIFLGEGDVTLYLVILAVGIVATVILSRIGYKILKR